MLQWKNITAFAKRGNLTPPNRVENTDQQWKMRLPADVYNITRQKGTERAYSSSMCSLFEPGKYECACCATPLFDSNGKYDSKTGWPSFSQPVEEANVAYQMDKTHGMSRIEATCNVCDAHLGHVFPDGPEPSGLRYCINALAIRKV